MFTDYGIGNGVIISTSFGSNGYYYYPERIRLGKWSDTGITSITEQFNDKKIGICHIIPAYLNRKSGDGVLKSHRVARVNYTVPFESNVKIFLTRKADARLYGTSYGSRGVAVNSNVPITISPSNRIAKIIQLYATRIKGNRKW